MILILDTDLNVMQVMSEIKQEVITEGSDKGKIVTSYVYRNISRDEMKQIVSFARENRNWIVVTYMPTGGTLGRDYEIEFNVREGTWKQTNTEINEMYLTRLRTTNGSYKWVWQPKKLRPN